MVAMVNAVFLGHLCIYAKRKSYPIIANVPGVFCKFITFITAIMWNRLTPETKMRSQVFYCTFEGENYTFKSFFNESNQKLLFKMFINFT